MVKNCENRFSLNPYDHQELSPSFRKYIIIFIINLEDRGKQVIFYAISQTLILNFNKIKTINLNTIINDIIKIY